MVIKNFFPLDSFTLITLQLPQLLFVQSLFPSSNSKPLELSCVTLLFSFYCQLFLVLVSHFVFFFKGYEVGWVWFAFFGREMKVAVGGWVLRLFCSLSFSC